MLGGTGYTDSHVIAEAVRRGHPVTSVSRHAPAEAVEGRVGGDVLPSDEEGTSFISGADFGAAVVDEVERPAHRRARSTVAY